MGFKTMVSPDRGPAPLFPPLARQGSIYNLTLDELQNQLGELGKPLSNMNLDELLKSVIAAEEGQVLHNPQANTANAHASSSSTCLLPGNLHLSQTDSEKMVNEVWKGIVQQDQGNAGGDGGEECVQRQPTLGEMTLEDFLIRAGAMNLVNQDVGVAVNPEASMAIDPAAIVATQRADWLQYHMAAFQQQQMAVLSSSLHVPSPVFSKPAADGGYGENQLAIAVTMPMVGATSSDSQAAAGPPAAAAADRKRQYSDEIMEKTIERRQKRMIKNRESAARSRARKQAYTNQLEAEVSNLRQMNVLLKKQKETNALLPLKQIQEARYVLRRTRSAPV